METPTRTAFKAATWQICGLITMTLIGYVTTGSFQAAGSIAIAGAVAGFVTFFVHERVWNCIAWGRRR